MIFKASSAITIQGVSARHDEFINSLSILEGIFYMNWDGLEKSEMRVLLLDFLTQISN